MTIIPELTHDENLVLSNSVSVYVPSAIGDKPFDNSLYTEAIAGILSKLFGGATVHPSVGYWIDDVGKVTKEPVSIVQSFGTAEAIKKHSLAIAALANYLKSVLEQEAISVEINNKLHVV